LEKVKEETEGESRKSKKGFPSVMSKHGLKSDRT
jgi:hypothetical protein